MRIYLLAGFIFISGIINIFAQNIETDILYFDNTPVIDGKPDETMNDIQWNKFSNIFKSDEKSPNFDTRFKILYGNNFLYLLIKTESDTIISRDRAYQNGDGFHLVIAKPVPDGSPSEEFYVLRFSPENNAKQIPAKKSIWYYNVDLSGKQLSSQTQFVCSTQNGSSFFELMLSWDDVYPYNPFFSEGVGFNLCFVKAAGDKDKNYYYLKYDKRIQSELSKREYLRLNFRNTDKLGKTFTLAQPVKRNFTSAENPRIVFISSSSAERLISYSIEISSTENSNKTNYVFERKIKKGLSRNEIEIPLSSLSTGNYELHWQAGDNSEGKNTFTILPSIEYKAEKSTLDKLKDRTSKGNYSTILFRLQSIVSSLNKLKPYETAEAILKRYSVYSGYIKALSNNIDSLSEKRGIFRRAFLSNVDSTLQPYTIKLPLNYNANNKYPLLVMLHGSGSDDTEILSGIPLSEDNFIEIAPYGRGTSNCFTTDNAQTDIKEAIEDLIRNYSVDTSNIIIAGFSMGGYGAYRTFYEYPKLFKAIAVFSGHPNLATKWIGEGYPDFLKDEFLIPFNNVPIFIYHSKNDLNCPYELTKELVNKLINAGAKTEIKIVEESGHGILDKESIPVYYKWLNDIIK